MAKQDALIFVTSNVSNVTGEPSIDNLIFFCLAVCTLATNLKTIIYLFLLSFFGWKFSNIPNKTWQSFNKF